MGGRVCPCLGNDYGTHVQGSGIIVISATDEQYEGTEAEQSMMSIINNIVERNERYQSLLALLLDMGKSEDAVRRYVADREEYLRTGGIPGDAHWGRGWDENKISRWKTWFLGEAPSDPTLNNPDVTDI